MCIRDRATLPAARTRLNQLAEAPPTTVRPPSHMTLEEAARPTPQEEGARGQGPGKSVLPPEPGTWNLEPDSQAHYENVAEAFSRKSTVYDAFSENHANMARMRRKFYDHIAAVMPAGGRLLEINAGTGQDLSLIHI